MTKKKNEKKINKESFSYKLKNDKVYKSKVELTSYVVLILIIILFINISMLGNTSSNNNSTNEIIHDNTLETQSEISLLDKIKDNYQYDININLIRNNEEINTYHYYGKSYDNTIEINKDINGTINTYYKVDAYYYKMEEEDYILSTKEEIYDLISSNYIELNNLLEYINEASLDHVTNYSSGKKESVYNLYLRDIILNNKTEDTVIINVIEENEVLSINVDYTNLIKEVDSTIKECKVNYIFSNLNNVEEFLTLTENTGEVNE